MPIARFQMPDGRVARFEVPDGTTPEQAQVMIQSQMPTADAMSRTEKVLTGIADPIHGGAQLLTKVLPDSVVQTGNQINNWLADNTGLMDRLPEGGVDAAVKAREADYEARNGKPSGIDGYRMLGNIISPANLAISRLIPPGATMLGKASLGAAGGATSAALAPVTDDDFAKAKAQQIGIGAAFGGATPVIARGLASVISPKASVNPDVQLLRSEGVTPTTGQLLGGAFNKIEEKLTSVPILGDMIAAQRSRANQELNRAAINRATAPIGVKVDEIGTEGVSKAAKVITQAYESAKSQLGGFRLDGQAQSELSNLRLLAGSGLEGRERSTFNRYFQDYVAGNRGFTADKFKEFDSKIGADVKRLQGSGDAYQQKLGDALAEVQRIVTENAKRSNPQAAAAMKAADQAYANLVRVEGASVAGKSADGVFTPGQLMTAVRAADQSTRDRATAQGRALMQDLASAGTQVLGNKVADSGTAGRLLTGGLGVGFGSGTLGLGSALAGLGGMVLYTTPMQRALGATIANRPDFAQPISQALQQAAPAFVPLGSQIGLGLLQ